ncbi:MAG TPA: hypothetical protein VIJ27_01725 [Mucilaginibacter sp.]
MKKLFVMAVLVFGCFSFKMAVAQNGFGIGVNIGSQPDWGPVGYHHVRFYYLPDIDAYYDVNAHQYVYNDNNVWVHGETLPPSYGNFDKYHSYKVVLNQRNPWEHQEAIRNKYAGYKSRTDQRNIHDSHDYHYRDHWK